MITKQIKKYYLTNPDIQLYKSLWNKKYYPVKDWDIDKTPIIIGITGSVGKSSLAYTLTKYLKSVLGKRVDTYSSSLIETYTGLYGPSGYSECTLEGLATFLYICHMDAPDYIIIECNDTAIERGVFDNLQFDYKILTSFKNHFNPHMQENQYLNNKLRFFKNKPCKTLLNIDSDCIDEFIKVLGENDLALFSVGPTYITKENKFERLDYIRNLTKVRPLVFPDFKLGEVGKSFFRLFYNNCFHDLETTLSLDVGIDISITLIATLALLNLLDMIGVKHYLKNEINIPGRCEDFAWNNRVFVVDSSNGYIIKKIIADLNSPIYLENVEKCKKLYKNYTPVGNNFNKIRVIYNAIGFTKKDIKENLNNKNYVFVNNISCLNKDDRYNFITFGANLYCLVKGLKELPTLAEDNKYAWIFDDVKKEIKLYNILDHSTQNVIEKTYLNKLYKKLVNICKGLDGEEANEDKFYTLFAWRSVTGLKEFFRTNLEDFKIISDYFKSYNNEELNNICDYVENKILVNNKLFSKATEYLSGLPIDKVYLTFANSVAENPKLALDSLKSNIKQPCETFTNRYKALEKMINESEEGDLLIIAGRGDNAAFSVGEYQFVYGTDKKLIKEIIEKNEKN